MNHIPESPVAIVGSRDFPDLEMVRAFVRSLPEDACVVSGRARGVDQAAEETALDRGMSVRSFVPAKHYLKDTHVEIFRLTRIGDKQIVKEWLSGEYPNFAVAAHTRNQMIVNEAGSVVAFWDGKSKGTKSTIDKARAAGILFEVYTPDSVTPST